MKQRLPAVEHLSAPPSETALVDQLSNITSDRLCESDSKTEIPSLKTDFLHPHSGHLQHSTDQIEECLDDSRIAAVGPDSCSFNRRMVLRVGKPYSRPLPFGGC